MGRTQTFGLDVRNGWKADIRCTWLNDRLWPLYDRQLFGPRPLKLTSGLVDASELLDCRPENDLANPDVMGLANREGYHPGKDFGFDADLPDIVLVGSLNVFLADLVEKLRLNSTG